MATPCNSFQWFLPERATKNVYSFVDNIPYMGWSISPHADNQISQSGYISKNAAGTKRGETPESASHKFFCFCVWLAENWTGATFFSQSPSVVIQNLSNREITLDCQLKTAPSCQLAPSSTRVALETRLSILLFVRNDSMIVLIYSCFCSFCVFFPFFFFFFYRCTVLWRAGCGFRECTRSLSGQ